VSTMTHAELAALTAAAQLARDRRDAQRSRQCRENQRAESRRAAVMARQMAERPALPARHHFTGRYFFRLIACAVGAR